ncbi:CAP domain-containing protein [Streptomyces bungoensis]|uniref:CAP domain-containing protein n=1 Tax=Streptomyces bungoensis TaxID=285568 RepID=UPI0034400DCC
MGKHRKQQHYRRFVIAAVAVSAVGVPSIAMACGDWQDGEAGQPSPAPAGTAAAAYTGGPWQYGTQVHHRHHRHHHGHRTAAAKPAAPVTVPPAPSAPQSTAPTPTPAATAPAATPTVTAPRPSSPQPTAPAPAPTSASASAPSSTPKPAATASSVVARVVELVNAERSKVGCSALTLNATLTKVAQAHSDDMAAHQNMSHTGSDGSSPGDRLTSAGYAWSSYGENVAYGYATPEDVMAGWMASPGHRENILNCSFKEIGVGLAQPNSYWTQDFGTSR